MEGLGIDEVCEKCEMVFPTFQADLFLWAGRQEGGVPTRNLLLLSNS